MNGKNNIFITFLKYVSLNILGMAAYSCYTLTDTFFVSCKLGSNGLAALNLAFPVFCFINGIGLMIGIGGGTKYSIQKSRNESIRANRLFNTSVLLAIMFSAAFVSAGWFFSEQIAKCLGADETIFSMTNTYLKTLLLFAPAFLANNLLQCFIRNDGSPTLSMTAMTIGCFSNIILDYIFVFPMNMGIFGAILATGLSPVISIIVLSLHFITGKNQFRLIKYVPQFKTAAGIISCGIPSFVTEASSGIVMVVFNYIILHLSGNVGVAAYGIIAAVSLVVVAVFTGLSQGIQPIISKSFGSGDIRDINLILKYALLTMIILSLIIYIIIAVFSSQIASVFNSEQNETLQKIAVTGLNLYFTAAPFIGFNIVISTYLTSTESPFPAQVISLLRGFFVLIPTAFILSAVAGMYGVWLSFPASELFVALIAVIILIKKYADS